VLPRSRFRIRTVTSLLLASTLAPCAVVGPDYHRPNLDVTPSWSRSPEAQSAPPQAAAVQPQTADQEVASWWTRLADPMLTSLVERAVKSNVERTAEVSR